MKPADLADLKVYTRDYSGLDSPSRGAGKFHASRVENGTDSGVAACNENILLVREEPWRFLKVPEAELCRSAACRKVFRQQVRGRKTGKPDRREGVPGSDRRAQRRRVDDARTKRLAEQQSSIDPRVHDIVRRLRGLGVNHRSELIRMLRDEAVLGGELLAAIIILEREHRRATK